MSSNVYINMPSPSEVRKYYQGVKGTARDFLSFLSITSLFIGFAGFFKTFMAFIFLGADPGLQVCFVVFLIVFSGYSLNKLTDLKEDAVNMPERLKFLGDHKKLILYCSLAAYVLAILLAFIDMPLAVLIVLVPFVSAVVYGSKLLPGVPRLKDIPVMKNLLVASIWAICATLLPAMHEHVGNLAVAAVFIFVFGKSIINTVLYDIRDIEGDRENGVRTIPVLIGTKRTVYLLLLLNSALLLLVAFAGSLWPLAIAMVIYGYAYILYFRKRRDPLVLDFFVDGEWMHACILFLALRGCGILA